VGEGVVRSWLRTGGALRAEQAAATMPRILDSASALFMVHHLSQFQKSTLASNSGEWGMSPSGATTCHQPGMAAASRNSGGYVPRRTQFLASPHPRRTAGPGPDAPARTPDAQPDRDLTRQPVTYRKRAALSWTRRAGQSAAPIP